MTPDEAAAILEVPRDASASDILAAYSKKAQAAGGSGALAAEEAEVQILQDARVTLMTHRQKTQGTQQRTEVAARAAGKSAQPAGKPEYGERAPVTQEKLTAGGWPDDSRPRKHTYTAEQELTRRNRSMIIAIIAAALSVVGLIPLRLPIILFLVLESFPLVSIALAIWALVRVRGYGGSMYRGIRIVAWVGIVFSLVSLAGNILSLVYAFSS